MARPYAPDFGPWLINGRKGLPYDAVTLLPAWHLYLHNFVTTHPDDRKVLAAVPIARNFPTGRTPDCGDSLFSRVAREEMHPQISCDVGPVAAGRKMNFDSRPVAAGHAASAGDRSAVIEDFSPVLKQAEGVAT